MTDEYGLEAGVTVTPDEAWRVYAAMDKPSLAGCAALLAEQGHKVSGPTLKKWSKRHEWQRCLGQAQAAVNLSPESKDIIFAVLKLKAEWMDPVTLRGLEASIAERMAVVIAQLPVDGSTDFNQMVEVLDKLDAIIHRHRGAAIGANGEARSPISLEEFRMNNTHKGNDPTSA